MVQILKWAIARQVKETGKEWDVLLPDRVSAYRALPATDGISPYELMFEVAPKGFFRHVLAKIQQCDHTMEGGGDGDEPDINHRAGQNMLVNAERLKRIIPIAPVKIFSFRVGDKVLVSICKGRRHSALHSKWTGPYTMMRFWDARCWLRDTRGKKSKEGIHISHLTSFVERN